MALAVGYPMKSSTQRLTHLMDEVWTKCCGWLTQRELVAAAAVSPYFFRTASPLVTSARINFDDVLSARARKVRVEALVSRFQGLHTLALQGGEFTSRLTVARLVMAQRGGWGSRPAHPPRAVLPARLIGNLARSLTSLDLVRNKLVEVPEALFDLRQLRQLKLGANPITTLSPRVAELSALRLLSLYSCELMDVPPEIGECVELRSLNLDMNKLSGTSLPEALGALLHLRSLSLAGLGGPCDDERAVLPRSIGRLTALRSLDLSRSFLSMAALSEGSSSSVWCLAGLRRLDLSNCGLSVLSPLVAQLRDLEELCLSGNDLCGVPDSVATLQSLRQLRLDNNPLRRERGGTLRASRRGELDLLVYCDSVGKSTQEVLGVSYDSAADRL